MRQVRQASRYWRVMENQAIGGRDDRWIKPRK